jgi:SET domain-containing protein
MIKIIKDTEVVTLNNSSSLGIYLSNGWKLLGEDFEPEVTEVVEPTKKEIQQQLDAKGIEYSPRDNKTTLLEKLEGSKPTDNFDDGLLKG